MIASKRTCKAEADFKSFLRLQCDYRRIYLWLPKKLAPSFIEVDKGKSQGANTEAGHYFYRVSKSIEEISRSVCAMTYA